MVRDGQSNQDGSILSRGKDGLKLIDIMKEKTQHGQWRSSEHHRSGQLLEIARLEEAIKLLTVLRAGWKEAAKKEDLAVPTTLLAGPAAESVRLRLHGQWQGERNGFHTNT